MNHQHLAAGQEVTFVDGDGKSHKAKVTQVFNEDEAVVAWDNGGAIAQCSDKKEPGTFHFEHQASPKAENPKK